ncbi:hypothetical protein [Treponema pedis]|uniref:hypothetical protein n=1 Tax=Treponema pedis TaxID=409322 RepID=UPI00040B0298|nr:hypothetical protein [Treponema pedis]
MKLEGIHGFFLKFQLKHRFLLLILLAAVTVFAAFGLKKFRTTYMTEEVFVNVNEYTKK